jgi:hypothetical protein
MNERSLVYGEELGSLVFLPEHVARETAEELDRIRMFRTYGEARAFTARRVWVPGLADPDEHSDEDAYDVSATPECQGGDWPPLSATIALDDLPDDLEDVGEQRDSMGWVPRLFIDPVTEREVLRYVRSLGYTTHRDDSLFARLSNTSDGHGHDPGQIHS